MRKDFLKNTAILVGAHFAQRKESLTIIKEEEMKNLSGILEINTIETPKQVDITQLGQVKHSLVRYGSEPGEGKHKCKRKPKPRVKNKKTHRKRK